MYEYTLKDEKHIYFNSETISNNEIFDTLDLQNEKGNIKINKSNTKDLTINYQVILKNISKDEADKLINHIKLKKLELDNKLKIQVNFEEENNNYKVDLKKIENNCEVYFDIYIPESFTNVFCKLAKGNIQVNDLKCALNIDNSKGDTNLNNLNGNFTISSSKGDIELVEVNGDINIDNSKGDVYLVNGESHLTINSVKGDINLNNVSLLGNNSFNIAKGDLNAKVENLDEAKKVEINCALGDINFLFPSHNEIKNVKKSFIHNEAKFNLNNKNTTKINFITALGNININ